MKITKYGHSCFSAEFNGRRILFDPGSYSTSQNDITGLDFIFITHKHSDHADPESINKILVNNPDVRLVTNAETAEALKPEGIECEVIKNREVIKVGETEITVFEGLHGDLIFPFLERPVNTMFLLNNELLVTGDSLELPKVKVRAVTVMLSAPWLRFTDSIKMILNYKPEIGIAVHDGLFGKNYGPFHALPEQILTEVGIKFVPLKPGESVEV